LAAANPGISLTALFATLFLADSTCLLYFLPYPQVFNIYTNARGGFF
jgi:hypothetical protein